MRRRDEAAVAAGGLFLLAAVVAVAAGGLPPFGDSDTLTRLAWLRDAWPSRVLDPAWARDGAPDGMLLQWTLPFNALSALLVAAFGEDGATRWAGPALLLLVPLAALPGHGALGSRTARAWGLALASTCTVVIAYGQPERLNHHVVTAAAALLAISLALSLRRRPTRARATSAGLAMALAFWQSMETVPALFVAWGFVLSALAERPSRAARVRAWASAALLGGLAAALAVDGPWPDFHPWTGHRLSLFHAALALGMCAGWALAPARAGLRGVAASARAFAPAFLATGLSAGAAAAAIPATPHGPLFDAYFWSAIGELSSVASAPALVLSALPVPILVALLWARPALRRPTPGRLMALGALACAVLLGMAWIRMAAYAQVLAILPAAALLASEFRSLARTPAAASRAAGVVGVAMLATSLALARNAWVAPPQVRECLVTPEQARAVEAAAGDGVVMADVWLTPALLHGTSGTRAVGGPYHGNTAGIEAAASFMTAPSPEEAVRAMEARGARHALLCTAGWYLASRPWPERGVMRLLAPGGEGMAGMEEVALPPRGDGNGSGVRLFRLAP